MRRLSTRARWRSFLSARRGVLKRVLDTADIVREAMLRQLGFGANHLPAQFGNTSLPLDDLSSRRITGKLDN